MADNDPGTGRQPLLKRNLKALAKFVSHDETRPILTAVHITDKVAEATDSYRLARIHLADDLSVLDFPIIGGKVPDGKPVDVCIAGRALVQALDSIPKASRATLPMLSCAAIADNTEHAVSIVTTDLTTSTITELRKVEGIFPDCGTFIEKAKADAEIHISFNARFLKDLATAFVQFGAGYVTVHIKHPNQPAYWVAKNDDLERMEAVLMPVREREAE